VQSCERCEAQAERGRGRDSSPPSCIRGPHSRRTTRTCEFSGVRRASLHFTTSREPDQAPLTAGAADGRDRRQWRGGGAGLGRAGDGQPRVASSAPPVGAAHPADLRGRPARVPALWRTDADHRVHHGTQGDREDPQAPRSQRGRRAQPARRPKRHRGRLIARSSARSMLCWIARSRRSLARQACRPGLRRA
jgi:hypothetical protein